MQKLSKLRAQVDYLEALEQGDVARMATLTGHFGRETGATVDYSGATPVKHTSGPAKANEEELPALADTERDQKLLTLDQFQAKYTTEDNASFTKILEKINAEKRARYSWIYDKASDKLLLSSEGDDNKNTATWKYTAKNALMYDPDGVGTHLKQELRGEPKEVAYGNTRLWLNAKEGTSSQVRTPQPCAEVIYQRESAVLI
jgi:protein DGCR14